MTFLSLQMMQSKHINRGQIEESLRNNMSLIPKLSIHVLIINYHIYIYIYIYTPSNVQIAVEDPKWTRAMNEEMKAREICSLPKTIGCK